MERPIRHTDCWFIQAHLENVQQTLHPRKSRSGLLWFCSRGSRIGIVLPEESAGRAGSDGFALLFAYFLPGLLIRIRAGKIRKHGRTQTLLGSAAGGLAHDGAELGGGASQKGSQLPAQYRELQVQLERPADGLDFGRVQRPFQLAGRAVDSRQGAGKPESGLGTEAGIGKKRFRIPPDVPAQDVPEKNRPEPDPAFLLRGTFVILGIGLRVGNGLGIHPDCANEPGTARQCGSGLVGGRRSGGLWQNLARKDLAAPGRIQRLCVRPLAKLETRAYRPDRKSPALHGGERIPQLPVHSGQGDAQRVHRTGQTFLRGRQRGLHQRGPQQDCQGLGR